MFTTCVEYSIKKTDNRNFVKKDAFPMISLCNCVRTIVDDLSNEEMPELKAAEIYSNIKLRSSYQNINPTEIDDLEYEFYPTKEYERVIIWSAVFFILSIDFPDKAICIVYFKEKATYSSDAKHYFQLFEESLQNYNHEQKQDVQEQKPENILKCATTFFAAIKKKGDKLPLNDRRKFISNEIESREHEHELFYDIY